MQKARTRRADTVGSMDYVDFLIWKAIGLIALVAVIGFILGLMGKSLPPD